MTPLLFLAATFSTVSASPCSPCSPTVPGDQMGDGTGGDQTSSVACNCEKAKRTVKDLKNMEPPQGGVVDIYFGSNNLGDISPDTFADWKKTEVKEIRSLYLQYNNVGKIEEDSFNSLKSLEILDLSNNKIETIPADLFSYQARQIKRINLNHNRIHTVDAYVFRTLNVLEELRLSYNFLTTFDLHALDYTSSLHTLFIDNNNLTQINKEWFSAFHQRWENSGREQHGQVFLHSNPWVCDCTTRGFVMWQRTHDWFSTRYDDKGYVDLGSCQYPSTVRGKHFSIVDETQFDCSPPRLLDHSDADIDTGKGQDPEIFVIVSGLPSPRVEFNITATDGSSLEQERFQRPPVFSEAHDQSGDGPAVKHSIGIHHFTAGTFNVTVTVTGKDQYGQYDSSFQKYFTVNVKRSGGFATFAFVVLLLMLTGLVVYKYRDEMKALVSLAIAKPGRGTRTMDYTYIPTEADTSALVSNEETFDPPEQTLRINV